MTLLIQDLRLEVIIGILPFERENPQRIDLDITLEYDYKGKYLNYVDVINFVSLELKERKYGLLEEALEDLIFRLKETFPAILSITFSIKKLDVFANCIVGVSKKEFFK